MGLISLMVKSWCTLYSDITNCNAYLYFSHFGEKRRDIVMLVIPYLYEYFFIDILSTISLVQSK